MNIFGKDMTRVFDTSHLNLKIKWYERLFLLFKPTIISNDHGSDDMTSYLFIKRLWGKMYIIDEKILKNSDIPTSKHDYFPKLNP